MLYIVAVVAYSLETSQRESVWFVIFRVYRDFLVREPRIYAVEHMYRGGHRFYVVRPSIPDVFPQIMRRVSDDRRRTGDAAVCRITCSTGEKIFTISGDGEAD
jgi:hypothetical protein